MQFRLLTDQGYCKPHRAPSLDFYSPEYIQKKGTLLNADDPVRLYPIVFKRTVFEFWDGKDRFKIEKSGFGQRSHHFMVSGLIEMPPLCLYPS